MEAKYNLDNTGKEVQEAIDNALNKFPIQIENKANVSNVLSKDNEEPYTPTGTYNPATKGYVDSKQVVVGVGTTTTGEPGTQASVTNTGTPSAPVFSFTIPKGDKGETGAQGVQGVQGKDGAKGDAATIKIGTVTTGAPTSDATVSNVGTNTDAVFNFNIPRGEPGIQGEKGDTGENGKDGMQQYLAGEGIDISDENIISAKGSFGFKKVPENTDLGTLESGFYKVTNIYMPDANINIQPEESSGYWNIILFKTTVDDTYGKQYCHIIFVYRCDLYNIGSSGKEQKWIPSVLSFVRYTKSSIDVHKRWSLVQNSLIADDTEYTNPTIGIASTNDIAALAPIVFDAYLYDGSYSTEDPQKSDYKLTINNTEGWIPLRRGYTMDNKLMNPNWDDNYSLGSRVQGFINSFSSLNDKLDPIHKTMCLAGGLTIQNEGDTNQNIEILIGYPIEFSDDEPEITAYEYESLCNLTILPNSIITYALPKRMYKLHFVTEIFSDAQKGYIIPFCLYYKKADNSELKILSKNTNLNVEYYASEQYRLL